MADVDQYLALVTSEHADKPNFRAVLTAIAQGQVDNINVVASLPEKFDVDLAVGQQLDFVGEWVGFARRLLAPITGVYFSADTAGLGFDEGVIFGPGSPTEGMITLDDDTYRLMIYSKIAANAWTGSLVDSEAILNQALHVKFPMTHLFIQDNQDMSITIGITGPLPSELFLTLVQQGYFALRPAGVLLFGVVTSPGPLFGADTENYNISGFDVGTIS